METNRTRLTEEIQVAHFVNLKQLPQCKDNDIFNEALLIILKQNKDLPHTGISLEAWYKNTIKQARDNIYKSRSEKKERNKGEENATLPVVITASPYDKRFQ